MGVRIVRQCHASAIPYWHKASATDDTTIVNHGGAESAMHHHEEHAAKQPPRVAYGYIRVAKGNSARAVVLKADLSTFCRANGIMLSTVFTDVDVTDTAVTRPGFASLLDVCTLAGSYSVVVPSRMHLSAHQATLEVLVRQIVRTGATLLAVDEITAVSSTAGGRDAHT